MAGAPDFDFPEDFDVALDGCDWCVGGQGEIEGLDPLVSGYDTEVRGVDQGFLVKGSLLQASAGASGGSVGNGDGGSLEAEELGAEGLELGRAALKQADLGFVTGFERLDRQFDDGFRDAGGEALANVGNEAEKTEETKGPADSPGGPLIFAWACARPTGERCHSEEEDGEGGCAAELGLEIYLAFEADWEMEWNNRRGHGFYCDVCSITLSLVFG